MNNAFRGHWAVVNFKALTLGVACLLIAGCASTPTTHYYTLHNNPTFEPIDIGTVEFDSVGIGPINLPSLLNYSGVVSFGESQEVLVSERHLWAGSLKDAVARVVAANVATLLDIDSVWTFPWDNRSRPRRQVVVEIDQLAGRRGGEVALRVKWKVTADRGTTSLGAFSGEYTARTSSPSYDAYIAAINDTVSQFSLDLAQSLAQISK